MTDPKDGSQDTELKTPQPEATPVNGADASRLDEFAKTATAAKMSGTFNKTAGFLKRKIGEMTDDSVLKETGRNQEILGKVHGLVGSVRSVREAAVNRVKTTRTEAQEICRKHGARLIGVATDFVEDIKKTFFK